MPQIDIAKRTEWATELSELESGQRKMFDGGWAQVDVTAERIASLKRRLKSSLHGRLAVKTLRA